MRSGRLVTWKSSGERLERELLLDADAAIAGASSVGGGAVAERGRGVIGVLRLSFK